MTETEKIIDNTLGGLFLNLSHVKEHRLGHRYRAYSVLLLLQDIMPELKKAGLVKENYQLPNRECILCIEGFFRRGDSPSRRCRLTDEMHQTQPVQAWHSCPILHRWDCLLKQGPNVAIADCTKSTSRNIACESDKPSLPPFLHNENSTIMQNFKEAQPEGFPLVKGGQGRSAEELIATANILTACFIMFFYFSLGMIMAAVVHFVFKWIFNF